jgi:Fanconi anemia group M protein
LVKPNTVQKRLYQELLTAKAMESSTLVVAPTGLGKTIVAILLIAYTYNKNKSILFMAPTKPLVFQHKKSLESILMLEEDKIILLTGDILPLKRKEIYSKKGVVLCATPQTIRNDINDNLINTDNFNLLIFDEAHRAIGEYAYVQIAQSFPKEIKRLALTASPGSQRKKIQDVADNLLIDNINVKTDVDYDVVDYIKDIKIDIIFTELDSLSLNISNILKEYIDKKILFLRKLNFKISNNYTKKQIIQVQAQIFERLKVRKDNILFLALSNTSSILKIYHAKELIETQGFIALKTYIEKLIIDSKQNKASKTVKDVANSKQIQNIYKMLITTSTEKLIYSKEKKLIEIISKFIEKNPKSKILVFNNFRDSANHLVNILNKNDKISSARFVGQTTKSLLDKGLSQKEQARIIIDFKEGKYNTLVCTSVGEEGLDIPAVDLVIFYDAVASEIRSIQRRGRTGRFSTGNVILLLNKNTIDEHYYYVSKHKEKKMRKILHNFDSRKTRKTKKQKKIFDF